MSIVYGTFPLKLRLAISFNVNLINQELVTVFKEIFLLCVFRLERAFFDSLRLEFLEVFADLVLHVLLDFLFKHVFSSLSCQLIQVRD